MARKQSSKSRLLDLSMDLQCILDNATKKEKIGQIIDKHDDLRRKEKREKEKEMLKEIEDSLYSNGKTPLTLVNKYKKWLDEENKKEDYFEKLDDENREGILTYLLEKIEEIRNDNEFIQNLIIADR